MRFALPALLFLGACASAHASPGLGPWPLRTGARWIYRGTVNDGKPRDVTYTVEVSEAKGDTARVTGDLRDLIGGREPTAAMVVRKGTRYYRDGELVPAATFDEVPPAERRICPRPDDERMCWVVEATRAEALSQVRGAPTDKRVAYDLVQRDNTGVQTLTFVVGVGFTAYRYHHNGSPLDVDVKLVELVPGK